ncbi:MAG TPA: Na+/H+ antiporter subunit B [Candidatus Hydrogenedens sp.]|nr:Na+/H+ antiporter subunit B [Candidatus Hydrogenedens sp.]HOK08493.1 Na+/H+ antiporter subunit B [Candidatus Hydrogenedens sp.]HOL20343.1 Na+/H+ antiporter subunit B [Candidatus Hydrogenedens sp.]HPP57837.1 Na+/H+ antiporter subunit B [Candidatus Hydrogenedens sp.]
MNSLILKTAAKYIAPLLFLFAIYLLLTGHNQPGGGFSGGLVASASFILIAFAFGPDTARNYLRFSPVTITTVGLCIACGSGVISILLGSPFMTGIWITLWTTPHYSLSLGTPMLFDMGVFLVVLGTTLLIILELIKEV